MSLPQLCLTSDLDKHASFGVYLDGVGYIVIKTDEGIRAFINECPHLGIPLEWQEHQFLDQDTQLIRCATHGALFLPSSGECVSGPCAGDQLTPVKIRIKGDAVLLNHP